jgi:hypothetical protein
MYRIVLLCALFITTKNICKVKTDPTPIWQNSVIVIGQESSVQEKLTVKRELATEFTSSYNNTANEIFYPADVFKLNINSKTGEIKSGASHQLVFITDARSGISSVVKSEIQDTIDKHVLYNNYPQPKTPLNLSIRMCMAESAMPMPDLSAHHQGDEG